MESIKRITIFGGSAPMAHDYQQALQLGGLLGNSGYTIITGGYIGTMEAVSRGANETGGHVIGVTCDEIEAFRPVGPNSWVHEEKRYPKIRQRLMAMIEECDAAVALPGGAGTLTEICLMWNHLLIGAIAPRPLILVGEGWKTTFDHFYASLGNYTPEKERRWLTFTPDVITTFDLLRNKKLYARK
jgi:uncharacterized protein (TIGR00730 family)